jgi:hypothetical protein
VQLTSADLRMCSEAIASARGVDPESAMLADADVQVLEQTCV